MKGEPWSAAFFWRCTVYDHFTITKLGLMGVLVLLFTVGGCGGEEESPPATMPHEEVDSAPEETLPQSSPRELSEERETVASPSASGVVLANKELGMTVSGQGEGSPERSLDMLERQVITLLPELRDVYERERAQDPALMGSLDVNMVIEPNGKVSDVRFPVKRISHDRLTSTVFDQLRAWTFPPADLPVQLRFTLLFVPPEIDEASILLWEKRLGSRPIFERIGEFPTPALTAAVPGKEPEEKIQRERRTESAPTMQAKSTIADRKQAVSKAARAKQKRDTAPSEITGWYRVLYPTALRSAPQSSAQVITKLQGGTRVRVVNVIDGQWLEVRSVADRPSGFLWWEDAAPERTERAERR